MSEEANHITNKKSYNISWENSKEMAHKWGNGKKNWLMPKGRWKQ